MMMRVPLALTLLLVASAYASGGNLVFPRSGCGCLRNPIAAELTHKETSQLRGYVKNRGVTHYKTITDHALQAYFRFSLINNFGPMVPSTRGGLITVISESLSKLTDKVVPSYKQCGKSVNYLKQSVPYLQSRSVKLDLHSFVASSCLVLHSRGVKVNFHELNVLLKSGLSAFLQSSAYKTTYSSLVNLIATLDHIDHNLPNILDQKDLIYIRRKLEQRFNLDSSIFEARYKLAIRTFNTNRNRILRSFNSLAYRGPKYEVTIQVVIKKIVELFPGMKHGTVRSILHILQLTNSGGGKASPKDLLAMISIPHLDKSLRTVDDEYVQRCYQKLPEHHKGLYVEQIQECYGLFIIGLASQGVQPKDLTKTHEAFVYHTQRFFLGVDVYTVEAYCLYVLRVVVPEILRGSKYWNLYIFDSGSVIVNNVLVPTKLTSIYRKGRDTIIAQLTGLQGNSLQITQRLINGGGFKAEVENIVNFKDDIVPANVPGYNQFEYESVVLSAIHLQKIGLLLEQRFNQLKKPSLQLPLLRIILKANVIPKYKGDRAAAAFRRIFSGLPQYNVPSKSNLGFIITQLRKYKLKLSPTQVEAGLQQFYVATRCLGYTIPQQTLPNVFVYTIRLYLQTLKHIPAQPFNDNFLQFCYQRLAVIIQEVTVVNQKVTIDPHQAGEIFKVFRVRINIQVQQSIIKWISDSKNLHPEPKKGVYVVDQYKSMMTTLVKRYPSYIYILSDKHLQKIQKQLYSEGIQIQLQYLRQANFMTYVCLGLFNRIEKVQDNDYFAQIVYKSVRYFLRMNKVTSIATVQYIRVLLHQYKVGVTDLPVEPVPVYQVPKEYAPAPIYIIKGINLEVVQVEEILLVVQKRFEFASMVNVQTILSHTIYLLRSSGRKIVQNNCFRILINYYSKLPRYVSLGKFNIEKLSKRVDKNLVGATISGTGIQSALVEMYMHMYYLKMELPNVKVVYDFFSYVIGAYSKVQVRRQLRFGKPFFNFCNDFLPKLPRRCIKYYQGCH